MGIYKSGVWTEKTFHELRTLNDGSVWLKIFYHNNLGGTVLFSTVDEAKHTNTENKYSLLYLLSNADYKGNDGKFEFMLCYPDDTTKYNRWKQINNPCDEYVATTSTGEGVAEGYEAIHIDDSGHYWGGLTRQNNSTTSISSTYLSGSVGHSNWHFAIGASSKYETGIPGGSGFGTKSFDTIVELWLRIDNTAQFTTKAWVSSDEVIGNEFIEI